MMTSWNNELKMLKRISDRAGVDSLPIDAHKRLVSREVSSIFFIINYFLIILFILGFWGFGEIGRAHV